MSDEQIRQILIERKRQQRKAEIREAFKEAIGDALCWVFWGAMTYMMFLGAYVIGG
ncbi:MAG: hypothetical protein IJJ31_00965 [Mogibacterium sp.]|nr:hypothetical protein [Mogibacterium sp.]